MHSTWIMVNHSRKYSNKLAISSSYNRVPSVDEINNLMSSHTIYWETENTHWFHNVSFICMWSGIIALNNFVIGYIEDQLRLILLLPPPPPRSPPMLLLVAKLWFLLLQPIAAVKCCVFCAAVRVFFSCCACVIDRMSVRRRYTAFVHMLLCSALCISPARALSLSLSLSLYLSIPHSAERSSLWLSVFAVVKCQRCRSYQPAPREWGFVFKYIRVSYFCLVSVSP